MRYLLVKFYIIIHLTANFVWSEEGIYVSRFSGNDTTRCGTQLLPCRTISYGTHQVFTGQYIYLDGTNTKEDPYTCQSLDSGHPGIYLTKSVSFVGIRSRAYISCLFGNPWLVDGISHNDGLRVSFYGLAFQNTSLRFFDALVNINDSLFIDFEHVSMNFTIFNLARFDLSLSNVVFERNTECMSVWSDKGIKIFVNMTSSSFIQNGNGDSSAPSILSLRSTSSNVNIELRNCSFQKNTFKEYGMIFVKNEGTTNVLLHHFKLEKNGHGNNISQIRNGIFFLQSAQVIMNLEFGLVYKSFGTFVSVLGQSAQISISNIVVNGYYSPDAGGGVVNIDASESGSLSIKDSSFRNGKNYLYGGVVSITAPKLILTIENSSTHYITNLAGGGVVYVQSHDLSKSNNRSAKFFAQVKIINSSFSDSTSGNCGAICLLAEDLFATINDSLFLRNSGGALKLFTYDTATILLHNVYFVENSAAKGGIVYAKAPFKDSTFNLITKNVWFVKNKIRAQQPQHYGILYLWIERKISSFLLKSVRFIGNTGVRSSTIFILHFKRNTFHLITLDTCILRKNLAELGALFVLGRGKLVCQHSVIDSNGNLPCPGPGFSITMNHSEIIVTNSTFMNNFCGALRIKISKTSTLKIENSTFVRNRATGDSGGAMLVLTHDDDLNHIRSRFGYSNRNNVLIENVSFKENLASSGSVLALYNGKVKILNCTFQNNFARFQGGQIASYGSTDLKVFDSVFKQTTQKSFIRNNTEFTASSFLRMYSTGQLELGNTTVDLDTICDEPLILASKAKRVIIDNSSVITCPLGSDIKTLIYRYKDSDRRVVTVLDLSCKECDYNLYSLQRGHAKGLNVDNGFKCFACPRGADCLPIVKAKSNFWGYNASLNPPTLAFTLCPFGYCKTPPASSSKYNDCQGKRTGVMCGSCSEGYTEALWSTYCRSIEDCNDHWFWIMFLALVLFMAILLVFKPPILTYSFKHILWIRRFACAVNSQGSRHHNVIQSFSFSQETGRENIRWSSTGQLTNEKRRFSRFLEIVFYFYQIAQLLLSSYSLSEFFNTKFLPPVLGFFNFEPSFHKRSFLCPFPGLTPKTKLVFKITPVFGTIIAILAIYFLNLLINKLRRTQRPSVALYLQASINTVFLGYVTLATVSISLVRCVSVAGEIRWFYNGNITCYQWWQYASFVFNGIFVIPFIFVLAWASFKVHCNAMTVRHFLLAITFPLPFLLLWLFRVVCPSGEVHVENSENLNAIKELLLEPYKKPDIESKHGALYWRSVLIARRFILVFIFCTVTEPSIRLFCMTLACVFVLFFHLNVKPFRNSSANNLESLSLLLLVILGLINLFKSVFNGIEGNIKGPLVTVFKVFQWLETVILGLFPAFVFLLVCFAIISLIIRVLLNCCRSLFKCLFRSCGLRWISHQPSRLLNICEEINN